LFRYYGFCYHLSYEIYFCSVRNFILTSIRHLSSYFLKEIIYYFIRNLYLHFQLPMLLYMSVPVVRHYTKKSNSQILVIHKPALFHMKMIRLLAKATRSAPNRQICCLSCLDARWDFGQRQPDLPPTGKSAAFHVWMQDGILVKGNKMGPQQANLLPFMFGCKMGFWTEATRSAPNRQICCLSSLRPRYDFGQKQPDRSPAGISAAFQV